MLETADRLVVEEGEPSLQQYLLLVGALRVLNRGTADGPRPASMVLDSYLLRALAVAGYAPSFHDCARCGVVGPHSAFSPVAGGVVCERCRPAGASRPVAGHPRAAGRPPRGPLGRHPRRRPQHRARGQRHHLGLRDLAPGPQPPLAGARRALSARPRTPSRASPSVGGVPLPTVVLDVNETLSDLGALAPVLREVGAPEGLLGSWFAGTLRDGFALTLQGEPATFADVARAVLVGLLAQHPDRVDDVDAAADAVLDAFRALPVHPDVPEGLRALDRRRLPRGDAVERGHRRRRGAAGAGRRPRPGEPGAQRRGRRRLEAGPRRLRARRGGDRPLGRRPAARRRPPLGPRRRLPRRLADRPPRPDRRPLAPGLPPPHPPPHHPRRPPTAVG